MTRKRSSPMGLEILLPVLLAFIMLPLLTQAAPLQDYTEIQQYTEGCYYNYNHYNEGDRIMTNEPCLNCTCHNTMLMCYLRVCPFTKPIGHDCIVEKREDQCCPIITCPEVPVDVAHAAPEPGTGLSFPEKFGCSIEGKFYLEGAQVPSNPNRPCELCYCIKNRTSCLMQECTLHIDGCTPIYNKGSCCPVRYNCDHENDVLELEDHSSTTEPATTTTTERPTTGFILTSTMTPAVSSDCIHNKEVYADGAKILGETACENCYCMRGDIVCAVQECHMPMLKDKNKLCHPLPAAEGECCPSNYVCEDDTTTEVIEETTLPYNDLDKESKINTTAPVKDLHSAIPEEDLQLQTHIDEEETATKIPPAEEEKETEIPSVRKPIDTESQQDSEKQSTTKYNEYTETTTVPLSVVESDKINEFVTAVPGVSDNLPESTTEGLSSAHDGDQTTTTTEKSKYSDDEDQTETTTRVYIETSEVSEISTDSTDTNESHTTSSSLEDKKSELEELSTTASAANAEVQSVTELTPTEEKEGGEPTERTEATTKMEDFIDVTEVNENESKPLELEDSVTETTKAEEKPFQYTTESSLGIESTTEEAEGDKQHEMKVSPSADEITTEISSTSFSGEDEEESTKSSIVVKEESADATTSIPEHTRIEESDFSTEKSRNEDEQTEKSTEISDGKEPDITTKASVESVEDEIATKLSSITDEELSTTSASKIGEDEGVITTGFPSSVDTVSSKEEGKPISATEEKLDITTKTPNISDDHTIPIFDDELGSGDEATSENLFETSTLSSATERVTSVSHGEKEDDNEIVKPVVSVKGKPNDEKGSHESSEESAESTESEEDNKLLDLTTAKSTPPDVETFTDGKIKYDDNQVETTTTRETADEGITKGQEKDTDTEKKPSDDIDSKEPIDATTTSVIADENLPTDDQRPVNKDPESTDIPEGMEATQKQESEYGSDQTENMTEKSDDFEYSTTEKSTTEQTTKAQTISSEEDQEKILPESDKTERNPTASPMAIDEDKKDLTTASPYAQIDIRKEDSIETEKTLVHVEGDLEQKTSTTIKPFVEPTFAEKMPDIQLPSTIPGEGDCLVEQKTFKNYSVVPTSDECEVLCRCISSIVVCERVKCDVPENVEKCSVDEASNNNCCPTYICNAVEMPAEDSSGIEITKKKKDDEIHPSTSPADAVEHSSFESTMKPISNVIVPSMSIPEIEMPVVFTEEPMSHVKDDDEVEIQTTNRPVSAMADEKHDVLVEDHSPIAPTAVEGIIVSQSMAPVESAEQEKHDMAHVVPEIGHKTEHRVSQEQPNKEVGEPITFVHEIVESTTAPDVLSPSDEKQESGIKSTSIVPETSEYQTIKPLEEEGSGDLQIGIEAQTATTLSPKGAVIYTTSKTFEEHLHTDEDKAPEIQTDREVISVNTEEPKLTQESETQTAYPELSAEDTSVNAGITPSSETQKKIQDQPTTPAYEISTKVEEQKSSSDDNSKYIIASTTVAVASKHDIDADKENIALTTTPSSTDNSESETSTEIQITDGIKDTDSVLEGSISTIAPVMENIVETQTVSEEQDKEIVKPIGEEQQIEFSTVHPKAHDINTVSSVETEEAESYAHTATNNEHKDTSKDVDSTTYRPEAETSVIHAIDPASENYGQNEEKEHDSSSTPKFEENTSPFTTPFTAEDIQIATEAHNDIEIKTGTSTLNSAFEDEAIYVPTTISSHVKETSESEEKVPDLHTEGSGEQQPESEEITSSPDADSKATEKTKEEAVTMVTVAPSVGGEEFITKSSDDSQKLEPQEGDQSTTSPQTYDKHTTQIIISDHELSTQAPEHYVTDVEQSSLHPLEGATWGPADSEKEVSTEPALIHSVSEFMTIRPEGEAEASGEEMEGVDKTEGTTEKLHNEIYATTELLKVSDEKELNEVPTDKTVIDDEKSAFETTISPESIFEHSTDKDTIPSAPKAPLDQLHTDQQIDHDTLSSVYKDDLPSENKSTEKSKNTTVSTDVQEHPESQVGSTTETEDQHIQSVTQAPTDFEDKADINVTHAPIFGDKFEVETTTHYEKEHVQAEDLGQYTEQTEEPNIDVSTTKAVLPNTNETQYATTEDVNIIATTRSPVSLKDEKGSEEQEPKITQSITTRLPSDETLEAVTAHIPIQEAEKSKEEDSTKGTENDAVETSDIDIGANTITPIRSFDLTTIKPSAEDGDEEGFSTVTTQLPTEIESEKESDEISDKATKVDSVPQTPITVFTTEIPIHSEEKSSEAEVVHVIPEITTEKLPEIKEETTEFSDTNIKTEKDKTHEETNHLEKDKLHEQFEDATTELAIKVSIPTEVSENVTDDRAEEADTDTEITTAITEMPAEVSPIALEEHDSDLTTKMTHIEDEKSLEQTTRLPEESYISIENVDQDITIAPVKDNEPEEVHMDAEVTTNKLQEYVTEVTTQASEENVKETEEEESHEHEIDLLQDINNSTESLIEYTTELPTKDKHTIEEEQELINKLSQHTTEAPSNYTESEDLYEKHKEPHEKTHEKTTALPVEAYDAFTTEESVEPTTKYATKEQESFNEASTELALDTSAVKLHASTTVHPLFAHHSTLPPAAIDSRIDDTSSHSTSSPVKIEEIFSTSSTASSTTTEPITTSGPHYQPPPPIYGQPPQYGPTQYEDEYTDEDEGEIFGPGTCRYGGKLYVSAQQIPRDDPCDFCFCFRSDIICLQQSCPPPIAGCHEEPISGFCCPRYECPVSMATVLNITTSTTTTSTTLPPHFLHHSYGNNVQRTGCLINGRSYRVGEKIESTSGPCINCACGGDGKMKCDPQACVPEPTMQQVMAVVASGRKR